MMDTTKNLTLPMQKLIAELTRLFFTDDSLAPQVLEQRMRGTIGTIATTDNGLPLVTNDGHTRAIGIRFTRLPEGEETRHWDLLCSVANALQTELSLTAPAVSIASDGGFCLWLSLAAPTPMARVTTFLRLLQAAYFPEMALAPDQASVLAALPPCLEHGSGKWAAFIHPDLGASFADGSGLEMAPPLAGQAALLERLHSISDTQLLHAIATLQHAQGVAPVSSAPPQPSAGAGGAILLQDATLEQIVRHLHSKNIEPTFRHLLPK